ncbi:hypothetical protein M441DRAFT_64186 [Trichoderma asperellum CBS 433.97]|uniref:Ig-like domain-containing protein n=1 Tax=Trichoderma asperellum (strain ATCC 204424 / CBS 433.97 / NBRC 101777) TaxID=1042311 RepID=A0A2T3ZQ45_TRIA4|nr:hypothetical protein M441DRAFT_64186 [Trichoderma asperellum CBS 433.97]PTB46936.1 hypothetical protein M441DRAFT_64186 [Trichoderma asperellum CBS 433.97]
MPSPKSVLSASLLLSTSWATMLAPPPPATATSTSLFTLANTTVSTVGPTATSIHCDITYCVNGTSFCHFWAGISTWYMSGPSPGELRTTVGSCKLGKARRTASWEKRE